MALNSNTNKNSKNSNDNNNENNNDTSSLPLRGCIFCCTSIAPESRTSIASTCTEMGGIHKLDLTPHVTHLIVGQIDTPKYKYVARERPDIKVLLPSFVEAVRLDWLDGGDVDLATLESKHAVPPFYGLTICATGFSELDGRQYIQDTVQEKGGTYSGDLTKNVTHLVAAKPQGRKYEYAAQWRVKLISMRWVLDSVERGMALEEAFFHPALSYDEQGKGALNVEKMQQQRQQQAAALLSGSKRPREDQQGDGNNEAFGKRKLRRTASSRLTSQNDGLWADIGPARPSTATATPINDKRQTAGGFEDATTSNRVSTDSATAAAVAAAAIATVPQTVQQPQRQNNHQPQNAQLIFKRPGTVSGERLFIQGFDTRKTSILYNFLSSAGALLLSEQDMLERFSQSDPPSLADSLDYIDPRDAMPSDLSVTIVVPHTASPEQLGQFQRESHVAPIDLFVTDFWVEKCLHRKALLSHTKPLCEPFKHAFPLSGMQSLTVCPTSFPGIDLLHFSKVVKLSGATYDETLTQTTSVLVVCHTADTGPGFMAHNEKVEYALQNKIAIVSEEWFWACLDQGKKLSFEEYGMMSERDAKGRLQFFHTSKRPRQAALKPNQTLREKPVEKQREKQKDAAEEEEMVLKDIPPEVNSPPKRKRPPLASPSKLIAPIDDNTSVTAEDENHQLQQQHQDSCTSHTDPGEESAPTQRTTNLKNAIAELLAQKRAASGIVNGDEEAAAAELKPILQQQQQQQQPRQRRHRPLGRAMSNTSSLGGDAASLSRSSSMLFNDGSRAAKAGKGSGTTRAEDQAQKGEAGDEAEAEEDEEEDSLDAELLRSNSHHQHLLLSESSSLGGGGSLLIKREKFRPSQALSYEDPDAAAVRERVMKRFASSNGRVLATAPADADADAEGGGDHDDDDNVSRTSRFPNVDGACDPRRDGKKETAATATTTTAATRGHEPKGVRVASIGTVKDSMGVAYTPGSETFSFLSNSAATARGTAGAGVKVGAAAAAGKRRAARVART